MTVNIDSRTFKNASTNVTNYARLLCVILEQGTASIKNYVLKNLPCKTLLLEDALAAKKNHFLGMRKAKVISANQFDILFPQSGLPIKMSNIDLSLWYVLARNLADNYPYVHYQKFEKNNPRVIDSSPQHDIIRIRNIRNKLFHLRAPEVDDETFESIWSEIRLALRRLGTAQSVVDEYILKNLDPNTTLTHYMNFREQIHHEYESFYKGEIKKRKQYLIGVILLVVMLIAIAILLIFIMYHFTGTWSSCIHSMKLKYSTSEISQSISYMPRSGWGAMNSKGHMNKAHYPVDYVIISHSAVSSRCMSTDDCCNMAQVVQKISFHRNLTDIGYNYLVGNDGVIYEGRPLGLETATARGWNNRSIGIGFMGTYIDTAPTDDALMATQGFLQYLVDNDFLTRNFTIYGMCQVRSIYPNAPGAALYNKIIHWHGDGVNTWRWREYPEGYHCNTKSESSSLKHNGN